MHFRLLIWAFIPVLLASCRNSEKGIHETADSDVVRDIDGNVYPTVTINGVVWMADNLRTTRFSNGDKIPLLLKDSQWKNAKGAGYCFFNNSQEHKSFGALYNLYAVTDKRNICPKGWHVPTAEETVWRKDFDEWKILNDKLFNNQKLGWRRIYDDDDKDEYSGFFLETRFDDGGNAYYWLGNTEMADDYSTEDPNDLIVQGQIMSSGSTGEYYFGNKYDGFPCRCVKDSARPAAPKGE